MQKAPKENMKPKGSQADDMIHTVTSAMLSSNETSEIGNPEKNQQ